VSINNSVNITAPNGIYAGVTALSGNGIDILGVGLKVTLRGLKINALHKHKHTPL